MQRGALPELHLRDRRAATHDLLKAGWRPVPTPHVEIRYRVRRDELEAQEHAVRHWMESVRSLGEDSVETSVLRSEDRLTFIHRLWFASETVGRRWQASQQELGFRRATAARCDDEPEILFLEVFASTVVERDTTSGAEAAAGVTL